MRRNTHGECTVGARLLATAEGWRTARLVIDHNASGGPRTVELIGHATAAPQEP